MDTNRSTSNTLKGDTQHYWERETRHLKIYKNSICLLKRENHRRRLHSCASTSLSLVIHEKVETKWWSIVCRVCESCVCLHVTWQKQAKLWSMRVCFLNSLYNIGLRMNVQKVEGSLIWTQCYLPLIGNLQYRLVKKKFIFKIVKNIYFFHDFLHQFF